MCTQATINNQTTSFFQTQNLSHRGREFSRTLFFHGQVQIVGKIFKKNKSRTRLYSFPALQFNYQLFAASARAGNKCVKFISNLIIVILINIFVSN